MGLAGKFRDNKFVKRWKSPGNHRGFLLHITSAFFYGLLACLFFWGCARQIHKPAEKITGLGEPVVRVAISEDLHQGTLSFDGPYQVKLEEARYLLDGTIGKLQVVFDHTKFILRSRRRYFEITPPQTLIFRPRTRESRFILNGIPYAGILTLVVSNEKTRAVNSLPMEKYLRGVVPLEIPSNENEYREAIYAQTVAARSYAFYHLRHPASQHFDLYADVRDQVYRGMQQIKNLADEAIASTRGLVLTNTGKIVETLYHSTCGGILEQSSISNSASSRESLTVRRDKIAGEFNCTISPLFRWVEIRQAQTLLNRLQSQFNIPPETIQKWKDEGVTFDLYILSRSRSGRVNEIELRIQGFNYRVSGAQIRLFLADKQGQPLPSNLFFLLQGTDQPQRFYIIGAGYGHGRGMCQWGAMGMSLRGSTYREILEFYYPELRLSKLY